MSECNSLRLMELMFIIFVQLNDVFILSVHSRLTFLLHIVYFFVTVQTVVSILVEFLFIFSLYQ